MATPAEKKVQDIVDDVKLTREQKIEKLRAIETEARALQRAASESAMDDDDGWQDELRQARVALDALGVEQPKRGAASL